MKWFSNLKIGTKILSGYILVGIIGGFAGHSSAYQSANLMAIIGVIAAVVIIGLALGLGRLITKPIDKLVEAADQLAQGNINIDLVSYTQDEIGKLASSFGGMVKAINALVTDSTMLVQAAVEGKLDTRADAARHKGEYRNVITGINNTLDAVIGPLNVAAEYVEQISKGDIPDKITDSYNGDFNEIKNNINDCIDAVNALVSDTNLLVEAAVEGKMDTRADVSKHNGDFKIIVQGVNATLDAIMEPLSESINVLEKLAVNDYTGKVEGHYQGIFAETAQEVNAVRERLISAVETNIHIAAGDFAEDLKKFKEVGKRSEEDRLVPSFIMSMENINRLVSDARMMADAAIDGRLDVRIDATQHQGEYRIVVEGINNTMDAVFGPVQVVNEFMDRVARGEDLHIVTEEYKGEFNIIKSNMNNCVNIIHSLLDETSRLTQAACEGKLDVRCDDAQLYNNLQHNMSMADTYLGNYYGNIAYQNGVLVDKNSKEITGDMQMVDALTADAGGVATIFAKSGDDFVRISTNIINDKGERAVGTMLGKSSLAYPSIYQGKHYTGPATILNKPYLTAYNPLFDQNRQVIGIMFVGIPQMQGSWSQLVTGINATLDAVVGPLNMTAEYIERIGKGDIPPKITDNYSGDFNEIKNNINNCLDGLGGLVESSAVLQKLAMNDYTSKVEGQYQGIFAETAEGVNRVLNSLQLVVKVFGEIGNGDLRLLETLKKIGKQSEADTLIPSSILTMENIGRLVSDARMLADAAVAGKLDVRADATQHRGDYRRVIDGVNNTMDELIRVLNISIDSLVKIGDGEIPEKINHEAQGDYNIIKNSINACIDGLGGLVESSSVLKRMAMNDYTNKVEGQYQGVFAETAADVNVVRDRLIGAVKVYTNISTGDFGESLAIVKKIGQRSKEDKLVPAMITSMENIQRLVDDAGMLAKSAVEGKLDVRVDATQHQGDYRRVVEGINDTLDAVIGPLNMAAEYIERIAQGDTPPKITDNYNGDFNEIKNNLNTCIESIGILVEEVGVAINAGVEGKLDQRANADRGKGVYHKILSGLNATMDALIAPVNEAIQVVNQMAKGSLTVKMTGNYQGDNAKLKDELNATIDAIAGVISEVSGTLGQLASGNLDISLDKDFQGDFISISSAIKHIIESLNDVMGDINHAAEEVAGGSQQVSNSSQTLAQGASEQASAIEQLTAAITEIAAQTKHNATNANQANSLALNARDNAAQGNEQMKEMLEAMEGINDSSANISKIIKVIDEIAFQTNILALNAAVEAARAGQHGKGFAVVAEEVRNLAARSASAAKETTDLIEGSIRKVQAGTKIANDTALALNKIVDGVSKAAELVGDIAVASNEQATGIAQVDQGIGQVSQVVQTTSATAQQSAAASEELSGQAGLLKERVTMFQLKGSRSNSRGYDSKVTSLNRNRSQSPSPSQGLREASATSGRARIALDDGDYGKY